MFMSMFVLLDLFLLINFCYFWHVYFIMNDVVYFIDANIITLNGRSVTMTF